MKILFLSGPALGHIGRLLVIAKSFRCVYPRSDILFVIPAIGENMSFIMEEGFSYTLIPFNASDEIVHFSMQVECLISDFDPHVILVDWNMLQWGATIVWPEIPRVFVTNIFLTDPMAGVTTVQDVMFASQKEDINKIREARSLSELKDYRELYTSDLVCLADPMKMTKNNALGRFCRGAVFYNYPVQSGEVDVEGRLLVVSMGSTGQSLISFDDFSYLKSQLNISAVVWFGGKQQSWFKDAGVRYFDKGSITPWMDKAVFSITQGGAGSTYLALSKGVPVLTVPSHKNQEIFGRVLESHGIGVSLDSLDDIGSKFDILKNNAVVWGEKMSTERAADELVVYIVEAYL